MNKLVYTLAYAWLISMVAVVLSGIIDMGLEYSLYSELTAQIKAKGVDLKVNRGFDLLIARGTENSRHADGATHADAWYQPKDSSVNVAYSVGNFIEPINLHEMIHAWDHAMGGNQYWSNQYYSASEKQIATQLGDDYAEQKIELLACFVTDGVDSRTTKAFWAKVGEHPYQAWSKLPYLYRMFSRGIAFLGGLLLMVVVAIRFVNKLRGRG